MAFTIAKNAIEEKELPKFISQFFPEMEETFKRIYTGNANAPQVEVEAEEFFENPMTYELMMRATTQNGVNANEVRRSMGESAVELLEKMRAIQLVKLENGIYFYDGALNANQTTVQKLLLNLVTYSYDLKNFGHASNMLTLQYESVDKTKVYPKLRRIIDDSRQSIRDLFNDPENKGSEVVWFALAMDTLQTKNNSIGVLQ